MAMFYFFPNKCWTSRSNICTPLGCHFLGVVELDHKIPELYCYKHSSEIKYSTLFRSGVFFLSPLCCDLVISILKIKCNLSFHWELVDCKLLHGRWLRAQVCGVANIHRVEICCIGSRGTAGEFVSVSQVIFTPIVVFIKKIRPHRTS
jgi:hypothetical protein